MCIRDSPTPVVFERTTLREARNYQSFTGEKRAAKRFPDDAKIQYKEAVTELYQRGILDGSGDGNFNPEWSINRAESLKVLFEALGEDVSSGSGATGFSDVPSDAWFAKYVAVAKQKGIVKGYSDGTFRPADTVNQVELLKLAFESFGIDLTGYPVNNLPSGIASDAWFASYLQYALDNDLLELSEVDPGQGLSRELFAEMVYRLIKQQESEFGTSSSVPAQSAIVKPVTAPEVTAKGQAEEEEKLSAAEAAAYAAEQAAAQAAQAARAAELAANTFKTIATGSIQSASGKSGGGSVTVEEKDGQVMITLGSDFSISNGPDLYVALSKTQPFTGSGTVSLDSSKVKILDALANQNGQQVYTISKADYDAYGDSLAIWCRQYNVLFGGTTLK